MFVLVPPKDPPTLALIERAIETLQEPFEGYENILLFILQVEGRPGLSVYFTKDSLLEKIEGVEDEAEIRVAEIVFEDKMVNKTQGQYFCTVVEYLPRARKYARAVIGLLFPNTSNAS